MATSDANDSIVGIVHNVEEADDKFCFDLQTEKQTFRVLCFSPQKRKQFEGKEKSPVKLTKYRKSMKSETLIFPDTGEVEPAKVDFEAANISGVVNLVNIPKCSDNQIISVHVQVTDVGKKRKVKNNTLDLQEVCVTDSTSSAKLCLFDDYCGQVLKGSSYDIASVRVKKDKFGGFALNTIVSRTEVKEATTVVDLTGTKFKLPTLQLNEEICGKIMGLKKFDAYMKCYNCNKKMGEGDDEFAECVDCGMLQLVENCAKERYVHVAFKEEEGAKYDLTIFGKVLKQVVPDVYEYVNKKEIVPILLKLGDVKVRFNQKSKVVEHISKVNL